MVEGLNGSVSFLCKHLTQACCMLPATAENGGQEVKTGLMNRVKETQKCSPEGSQQSTAKTAVHVGLDV